MPLDRRDRSTPHPPPAGCHRGDETDRSHSEQQSAAKWTLGVGVACRRLDTTTKTPQVRQEVRGALIAVFRSLLQRLVQDWLHGGQCRVPCVGWRRRTRHDRSVPGPLPPVPEPPVPGPDPPVPDVDPPVPDVEPPVPAGEPPVPVVTLPPIPVVPATPLPEPPLPVVPALPLPLPPVPGDPVPAVPVLSPPDRTAGAQRPRDRDRAHRERNRRPAIRGDRGPCHWFLLGERERALPSPGLVHISSNAPEMRGACKK